MHRPLLALFAIAASACNASAPETTVAGQVDRASFPAAIGELIATSTEGDQVLGTIDDAGAFELSLPSATTYRLELVTANGRVPVAMRTLPGGFGSLFHVATDGAAIDVGTLHYRSLLATRGLTVGPDMPELCVEGATTITGRPCVGDTAPIDCSAAIEAGLVDAHDGHREGDGHRGPRGDHRDDHDGAAPHAHGSSANNGLPSLPSLGLIDLPITADAAALPDAALPFELACGMVGC